MIQLLPGYMASVLLAISLMVSNELPFRWLNTLGCMAFIVYGILIGALPVILTNGLLLLINAFYLLKIYRTSEKFDLLEFEPGATLVNKFLTFYEADIHVYFPAFKEIQPINTIRFVVLRYRDRKYICRHIGRRWNRSCKYQLHRCEVQGL